LDVHLQVADKEKVACTHHVMLWGHIKEWHPRAHMGGLGIGRKPKTWKCLMSQL
jgi:hypothetical protein